MPNDDQVEKSRSALLISLEGQLLKQHSVHDAQGRVVFLFEAPVNAKDGEPCLVTEYVYLSPTSTQVKDRQESHYRWKSAWEADFTFDQNADYDPDNDGVL